MISKAIELLEPEEEEGKELDRGGESARMFHSCLLCLLSHRVGNLSKNVNSTDDGSSCK